MLDIATVFFFFILFLSAFSVTAYSSTSVEKLPSAGRNEASFMQAVSEERSERTFYETLKDSFGMTYFSYCYGPGLHPDKVGFNPNQLGLPQNDGNYLQNQVSLRYKVSDKLAIDFQSRFSLILNNHNHFENFSVFRWQTPRIGISGRLMTGDQWTLTGAVNTDFPYFLPVPLSGYQSRQRKVIFTPGMFASFKYEPKQSRWVIFSMISPRYLIYADPDVVEPQFIKAGYYPRNKPEFILAFQPTIGYRLSSVARITLGSSIDYRKHLLSSWNMFNASLSSNGSSSAWRLDAIPINLGVTFDLSSSLTIFPFFVSYPIAIQRVDANTGKQASFLETASVGMWIYGTLF